MIKYEDVPDDHWMILNHSDDTVLFHAQTLDKVLEESDKYEDDQMYISKKHIGLVSF